MRVFKDIQLALKIASFLVSQIIHTTAFTTKSSTSLQFERTESLQVPQTSCRNPGGSGSLRILTKYCHTCLATLQCKKMWSTVSIAELHMTQVAVGSLLQRRLASTSIVRILFFHANQLNRLTFSGHGFRQKNFAMGHRKPPSLRKL